MANLEKTKLPIRMMSPTGSLQGQAKPLETTMLRARASCEISAPPFQQKLASVYSEYSTMLTAERTVDDVTL